MKVNSAVNATIGRARQQDEPIFPRVVNVCSIMKRGAEGLYVGCATVRDHGRKASIGVSIRWINLLQRMAQSKFMTISALRTLI